MEFRILKQRHPENLKYDYSFCWSSHFDEWWGNVIDVYWEEE